MQIELLALVVPGLSRVALRNDSRAPVAARYEASAREASVDDPGSLGRTFEVLERQRLQALVVLSTGAMNSQEVAAHARRLRLPSIGALPAEPWVGDGGLMAYAANIAQSYRSAAGSVERILRSAGPAELPVEQSTRFQFILHLKRAREIGLVFPQSILLRVDAVVE